MTLPHPITDNGPIDRNFRALAEHLGSSVTAGEAAASASLTLPLNSWSDITGCSASLAAGTYLIRAVADLQAQSTAGFYAAQSMCRCNVGGTAQSGVAVVQSYNAIYVRSTAAGEWKITLGSTTTVKLEGGRTDDAGGGNGIAYLINTKMIWEKIG